MTCGDQEKGCLKSLSPEKCDLRDSSKSFNFFFTACGCLTASLHISPGRNRAFVVSGYRSNLKSVCLLMHMFVYVICAALFFSIEVIRGQGGGCKLGR